MSRPLCRNCGKPIAKKTVTVYFITAAAMAERAGRSTYAWERYVVGDPRTRAEVARLVNDQVTSVKRGAVRNGKMDHEIISRANVWDGESYADPFFCTGTCAQGFGYMVARNFPTIRTVDYAAAVKRQQGKENAP